MPAAKGRRKMASKHSDHDDNPLRAPRAGAAAPAASGDERRKHRRLSTRLKARYLDAQGREKPCLIVNISAGGALLKAKSPPAAREKIILYIDQVGRFEASVIRSEGVEFAVSYAAKRAKNARTADNLTKILNQDRQTTDRRRTPRIEQNESAVIYLEDGAARPCAIMDISLTGASLEIAPRPPLGSHVILGRMTAKVVRRHDKGVSVIFTGGAERMDDIIKETAAPAPQPVAGAPFAPSFGKKGPKA